MRWLSHALPVALALGIAFPSTARADADEWAVGAVADWQILKTARLGVGAERGLNDFLAVRAEAQAAFHDPGWTGLASLGPTVMLDVLSWVPAFSLQAGLEVGSGGVVPRGLARLELRHFVAAHLWVGGGVGVERTPTAWRALVGLSVFELF